MINRCLSEIDYWNTLADGVLKRSQGVSGNENSDDKNHKKLCELATNLVSSLLLMMAKTSDPEFPTGVTTLIYALDWIVTYQSGNEYDARGMLYILRNSIVPKISAALSNHNPYEPDHISDLGLPDDLYRLIFLTNAIFTVVELENAIKSNSNLYGVGPSRKEKLINAIQNWRANRKVQKPENLIAPTSLESLTSKTFKVVTESGMHYLIELTPTQVYFLKDLVQLVFISDDSGRALVSLMKNQRK